MSLPVTTTPEADAQIRTIDDWRRENRPASPDLFFDELLAAFEIIGHAPNIGRLYRPSPVPGMRRIVLRGAVNVAKAKLEGLFVDELKELQPTPAYMRLVKEFVLQAWQERKAEVGRMRPTPSASPREFSRSWTGSTKRSSSRNRSTSTRTSDSEISCVRS